VALSNAITAAYISPFISAARYGSSAIFLASTLPQRALRTYRIRSTGYLDLKPRSSRKHKAHEITLTGDQTRGLQTKVARTRGQGKAAREYTADSKLDTSTLFADTQAHRFDRNDWEKMLSVLMPANEGEIHEQQKFLNIGGKGQHPLFNITIGENLEDAGAQAGLLGVSAATANTLCDDQPLGKRTTVLDAFDWLLKANNHRSRPIEKLLDHNFRLFYDGGVESAWTQHPEWRYDPLDIVRQSYITSTRFRGLLNQYDDQVVDIKTIRIIIALNCELSTLKRHEASATVSITLPADPGRLPFIVTETQIVRQSIALAIIEGVVGAITRAPEPAPDRRTRERGVNIWLANQILLQGNRVFTPRVNAAFFTSPTQSLQAGNHAIRDIRNMAELEEQYLERISKENLLTRHTGQFQGEIVAQRPTVHAVITLLDRLAYPAYLLKQANADIPDGAGQTRGGFLRRLQREIAIDTGHDSSFDTDLIYLFLSECYDNSNLFRVLFDNGIGKLSRRWTLFPNGFEGDGGVAEDRLIPMAGIINAGASDGLYLGLIETEPVAENISLSLPGPQLIPLEPFRRILDGLVAVLSNDTTHPSRADALHHRGAVTWLSDAILWQSGWPANKRLARITLSSQDSADGRQLTILAPANRRAARVEDSYLLDWLNRQLMT
jgi:hypothetical protein